MKRFLTAVLAPVLLGASLGAPAASLSDCGLEVARARNTTELDCYLHHGPKSGDWSVANQGPLDACLVGVNDVYAVGLAECNAMYASHEMVEPLDPHHWTVRAAGIVSFILLWISP